MILFKYWSILMICIVNTHQIGRRDIVIKKKDNQLTNVNEHPSLYDSLQFPLLFLMATITSSFDLWLTKTRWASIRFVWWFAIMITITILGSNDYSNNIPLMFTQKLNPTDWILYVTINESVFFLVVLWFVFWFR